MTATLYILTALVEVICYHNIFYAFSDGKIASIQKRLPLYAFYVVANVLICLFNDILLIQQILLFLMVAGISLGYFMKTQTRIIACVTCILICITLEFFAMLILSDILKISMELIIESELYSTALVVIGKSITLIVSYIIKHTYKIKQGTVSKLQLIPYALSVFISIFVLDEVFTISAKAGGLDLNSELFGISIFVVVSNIILFLSFEYVLKVSKEKNDAVVSQMKMQSERVRYEDIAGAQKQIAKKLHDVKNQMFGLKELIEAGDPRAIEYINEICEMQNAPAEVFTGINSIDGILKSKQEIAEGVDVNLNIKSSLKMVGTVDSIDVCVIIGNLLDNAIESAKKQIEKTVLFDISQVRNYMKITVKNTCENGINLSALQTTKQDKLSHGHGIPNVKEIVSKNNGIINLQSENGWFEVVVLLKN